MEQWIQGSIETYDGICDHQGDTVFYSSMHYGGLMEVVSGQNESMFFCVAKYVSLLSLAIPSLSRIHAYPPITLLM